MGRYEIVPFLRSFVEFSPSFIEFFHPKAQVFCLKTQFPQNTQRTSNILNALANQLFIRCLYYIRYKFFSMR